MRFKGLDLNLLVVLDAIIEDGSVSAAAVRLNMTQASVSNVLARLRFYFKDDLLTRVGRKMVPTPFALRLAATSREALLLLDSAIKSPPVFNPEMETKTFSVIMSDLSNLLFIPTIANRLTREAPNLSINVYPFEDVSRQFERGTGDLIVTLDSHKSELHPYEKLYQDEFVLLSWLGNEGVSGEVSLEHYSELNSVTSTGGLSGFETWFARVHGVKRRSRFSIPAFTIVPQILVGTSLVSVVPGRVARFYAKQLPLRISRLQFATPEIIGVLQWHRHDEANPALKWLRALFLDAAAEATGD